VLVGRSAEVSVIEAHVGAPAPTAVLQLVGEAGIGKSALIEHAVRGATERGITVLMARGSEFAQHVAFGGLADMLRPIAPAGDFAALFADTGHTPLAVHQETAELVRVTAVAARVAIFVDDVHWLDAASGQALRYLALHLDGVPMVFAARSGHPTPIDGIPHRSVALGALDPSVAAELMGAETVAIGVARACHAATNGNTLSLIELAATLSAGQLGGRDALPDPLPLGRQTEHRLRTELAQLPANSLRALCIVAAEETGDMATIVAALNARGLTFSDVESAESLNLIDLAPDRVRWRHPLYRSAAYYAATPAERRAAHAALAGAVTGDESDALRGLWHGARAAVGPDDHLAELLMGAGEQLVQRGALVTAGDYFERAGRLMTSTAQRSIALRRAGHVHLQAGSLDGAHRLLTESLSLVNDPVEQTAAIALLGETEAWRTGPAGACELLVGHARSLAALTPQGEVPRPGAGRTNRTHLFCVAGIAMVIAGNFGRICDMMDEANAGSGETPHDQTANDQTADDQTEPVIALLRDVMHGCALIQCGQPAHGIPMIEAVHGAAVELIELAPKELDVAGYFLAVSDTSMELFDRAESVLRRIEELGRVQGFGIEIATVFHAEVLWRVGRWGDALTMMRHQAARLDPLGPLAVAGPTHAILAKLLACTGDSNAASHGSIALAAGHAVGSGVISSWAHHALGLVALPRGDANTAVDHLRALAVDVRGWRSDNPGSIWWAGDLVDALIDAGHRDEAVREIEILERQAALFGTVWPEAMAQRSRARLTDGTERTALAREAAKRFATLPAPFEQARSLLVAGDAAEALTIFESLGAAPWATVARVAAFDRVATASLLNGLSTAERRIARAAVSGQSNKAIAHSLNVSAKTVEFHLGNVYRKLQVASRTELAAHWGTELSG
jgi:DNA-binding CsgD family transcriptional regulator